MEFCKAFNAKTESLGKVLQYLLKLQFRRSFFHIYHQDSSCVFPIKESTGHQESSGRQTLKVGTVTRAQLEEIAKTEPDLTTASLDAAVNTIAGSARGAGLECRGLSHGKDYLSACAQFLKK